VEASLTTKIRLSLMPEAKQNGMVWSSLM
jgi:hypothetical protein